MGLLFPTDPTPAANRRPNALEDPASFELSRGASDVSTPAGRGARLDAHSRGRDLAERMRNITVGGVIPTITLGEFRGGTGVLREGLLEDLSEEPGACCTGLNFGGSHFAAKGPWMLKFKGKSSGSRSVGVPIPLDGALVVPQGLQGFEISNVHVKGDFFGKQAVEALPGIRKEAFSHSVQRHFHAPSPEERDQWVQALQAQVARLADRLAKRRSRERKGLTTSASGTTLTRVGSGSSALSTATAVAVNRMAAALFAEYEEEEEMLAAERQGAQAFGIAAL